VGSAPTAIGKAVEQSSLLIWAEIEKAASKHAAKSKYLVKECIGLFKLDEVLIPIYPCVLIFVTGKLNFFSKKFTILKATTLFQQFWSFLGFAALTTSVFRYPRDLD
jgi:hypothetical protein